MAQKYYYLTFALLAVCGLIGCYIAFRFQREVNEDLGPTTEKDLLDPLEKAFYSGLMDEEEFKRIQASVDKQKAEKPLAKPVAARTRPGPKRDPSIEGMMPMGDGGTFQADPGHSHPGDFGGGHSGDSAG